MGVELPRFPATDQSSEEMDKYGDVVVSFADTVFGFWEDVQASSENSSNSGDSLDYDDENENFCTSEQNKTFWEEQEQLLQVETPPFFSVL